MTLADHQDAAARTASLAALSTHHGSRTAAARELGVSVSGLRKNIERLRLEQDVAARATAEGWPRPVDVAHAGRRRAAAARRAAGVGA